jgi:prepilin-type N-terminal cleavage/methylation domain-containing protein
VNNKGLTLIEIIVAMVISCILCTAFTCQFVAEASFRKVINDQVAATNDVSTAMCHMTRVLRYAKRSGVSTIPPPGYIASIKATIDHEAAGSNLPEFAVDDTDIAVAYRLKSNKTFEYKKGDDPSYIISKNITEFLPAWANPNITIRITAQHGSRSSSLNTKIRALAP